MEPARLQGQIQAMTRQQPTVKGSLDLAWTSDLKEVWSEKQRQKQQSDHDPDSDSDSAPDQTESDSDHETMSDSQDTNEFPLSNASGETISATSPDDFGDEQTITLPDTADPDDLDELDRRIIETAVVYRTSTQGEIADRVGTHRHRVGNVLRDHFPAHASVGNIGGNGTPKEEILEVADAHPDWTQKRIADEAGVGQPRVSRVLKDHRPDHPSRRGSAQDDHEGDGDDADTEADGEHTCPQCGAPFENEEGVRYHIEACGEPWHDPERLAEAYEAHDQSLIDVADELGCSRTTARKWAVKHGIHDPNTGTDSDSGGYECPNCDRTFATVNARNAHHGHCTQPWQDAERLVEVYNEHGSVTATADAFGCCPSTISVWLDKLGIADDPAADNDGTEATPDDSETDSAAELAAAPLQDGLVDLLETAQTLENISENDELCNFAQYVIETAATSLDAAGVTGGDDA